VPVQPAPPPDAFDGGEETANVPKLAPEGLHDEIDALERQRILDALEQCGGNQTRAAKLLGIARGTLIARLATYGVKRPRK
jgi:DNA-binding NtrC family response regulator